MGSLKRKLERKRARQQKKVVEKEMRRIERTVNAAPKICGECGADFDNTNQDMLNEWRIAVYEDGRVHLTCPECGPTPEEIEASLQDERLNGGA
tara:strand:+ start:1020 stop:1301 length:282 start_codon:yes stop_codon:yes gene_type:complete